MATPDAGRHLDPSRLTPADRAEWAALRTPRRRLDWASSRALLGAAPAANPDDCASSLSHSHGFAVLARAPRSVSVGVDVEWLAPRDFRSMARTAYSALEADELESVEDPAVLSGRFYEFWTLKEAFAKALRLPLADALRQCCFAGAGRTAASAPSVPTTRHWRATVFAPRPQLRLAAVFVADTAGALAAVPVTVEWPPEHPVDWPVVRRHSGRGIEGAVPC